MKRSLLSMIAVLIVLVNFILLFVIKYIRFLYILQIFTHFLTIISLFYLVAQFILPTILYKSETKLLSIKNDKVKNSGEKICSIRCGGQIGSISINGPLLDFTLYPIGLQIKPIMIPAFSILYSEISGIESNKFLIMSKVKISHSSQVVASPFVIYLPKDNEVIVKLRELI